MFSIFNNLNLSFSCTGRSTRRRVSAGDVVLAVSRSILATTGGGIPPKIVVQTALGVLVDELEIVYAGVIRNDLPEVVISSGALDEHLVERLAKRMVLDKSVATAKVVKDFLYVIPLNDTYGLMITSLEPLSKRDQKALREISGIIGDLVDQES